MGTADFNADDHDFRRDYENPEFSKAWDSVKDQLKQKLVIAFLGTASSGKTSGIKALFDIDLGNIHPIPGSTTQVKVFQVEDNVFVADAPGFGDIQKDISQKAKDVCNDVDIFVYILNAEGGYKQPEKDDYQSLRSYKRPALVVLNKIDLLRDHQKAEFIEDQREKMGVEPENFIPASFDPHPAISRHPINLDKVEFWISDTLKKKGKDLLFAKYAREKDKICRQWIRVASAAAAGIGALPIPGSDFIPLTALQGALMAKIAYLYGHSISKEDAVALIAQLFATGAGRQIFRLILTSLKAVGWIPGAGWLMQVAISAAAASLAASLTWALGISAQAYYRSGMQIPIADLQDVFRKAYDEYPLIQG